MAHFLWSGYTPYQSLATWRMVEVMKNTISKSFRAILLTGALVTATSVFAQTAATTTTTTSVGTISEFGPDMMMITTETSPTPVRYSYSKTTTYVDETGSPVSVETVKSGQPVTITYEKVGDQMVASKVVVKKAVVVPVTPVIEERKTTTTTETTE